MALAPLPRGAEQDEDCPEVVFLVTPTSEGVPALLAFSDPAAFERWGLAPSYARLPAAALIVHAVAKGIGALRLDAAGPVAVTLEDWELAALAEGRVPEETDEAAWTSAAQQPPPTRLGPPVVPVEQHLLAALRAALATRPDVLAAYVFEADRIGLRRQLVVGLDLTPETSTAALETLVDALAEQLAPLVAAHAVLRFTRVEPDDRLQALARDAPPVYVRAA